MAVVLLLVSLDSENVDWLREHMAIGNLPNLAALARAGVTFDVNAAALAGIAYPTLYTGQRAADLGAYFPVQWEPREQRLIEWTRLPLADSVFARMEQAGKRLIVLDPPELQPIRLSHGFCASGVQFRARFLLHSWSTDSIRSAGLMQRLGPAPRADEVFGQVTVGDLRYMRTALLQAPARMGAAALSFLKHDPPDCLWVTCCGMHLAGHQFYHLPSIREGESRRELEGTRLELAQGYDRMIGSLAEALPAGSRVMVTFAKGMGQVTEWSALLPDMLQKILRQSGGKQPVSRLRRWVPRSLRRWAAQSMNDRQAVQLLARLSTPQADWARTRAFCLPTDNPGFVQFNLAGRERHGVVPDSALQGLQEEISEGLRSFVDADGISCVEQVVRPRELLGDGTRIHQFPDLIVNWKQRPNRLADGVLRSELFGEVRQSGELIGRSGNHCPGAFTILSGGDPMVFNRPMDVEDIPATMIGGLGISTDGLAGSSFWPSA